MNILPINHVILKTDSLTDRVIIEPLTGPEKIGGIYIPEQSREKGTQGIVVAVGPGRMSEHGAHIPMTVKVGDESCSANTPPAKLKLDGKELSMIHENEINCIVKK